MFPDIFYHTAFSFLLHSLIRKVYLNVTELILLFFLVELTIKPTLSAFPFGAIVLFHESGEIVTVLLLNEKFPHHLSLFLTAYLNLMLSF